jgi:hypothetical protein
MDKNASRFANQFAGSGNFDVRDTTINHEGELEAIIGVTEPVSLTDSMDFLREVDPSKSSHLVLQAGCMKVVISKQKVDAYYRGIDDAGKDHWKGKGIKKLKKRGDVFSFILRLAPIIISILLICLYQFYGFGVFTGETKKN